jgi:3-oxoacyl-[acyl-carrier protein] reductase
MDLGIRGRTAIVCASSQGLGKGCALGLAEAGVALIINGRNQSLLEQTAQEIRKAWNVEVTPAPTPTSSSTTTPDRRCVIFASWTARPSSTG